MSLRECRFVVLIAVVLLPVVLAGKRASADELRLTLPAEFYSVVGVETSVYFDNIVLTESPSAYRFRVVCSVGNADQRRWSATATDAEVGTHEWKVQVVDRTGTVVASGSTKLHIVGRGAGADRAIRILIVGDSLTHATLYPNEIARLLSLSGNPRWTMLGTHRPKSAAEGVRHEGYGGWTWKRFVSYYDSDEGDGKRRRRSPFVYRQGDAGGERAGKRGAELAVERYIERECGGVAPDYVTVMLGIHDCFSAPPDDSTAIDARIDEMLGHAEKFLAAFRRAAPRAEFGICLTTPPNARDQAFDANYKGRYTRWGWKRIQHRLVERQLEFVGGRAKDGWYVIPTELNLDPVGGYPENNAVHPNGVGYRQIGGTIYAWLKWRMAD